MKKLFCVVVEDPDYVLGSLDSALVFHIKCEDSEKAEEATKEMLVDEYEYDRESIEGLNIFPFEVRNVDIIEA